MRTALLPFPGRLLLMAIAFAGSTSLFGQLVYIPDAELREELQEDCPAVMVGDSLNTAAPELQTITYLDLSGVADLTGIEHFVAVDSLRLDQMGMGYWPQVLPPNVRYLFFGGNGISVVQGPFTINPSTLRRLELRGCTFPEGLALPVPTGVLRLKLTDCDYDLPLQLPAGLERFEFYDSSMLGGYTYQPTWPVGLDTLIITAISAVSTWQGWFDGPLPNGLKQLVLQGGGPGQPALQLPALPSQLEDVRIDNVHVDDFPVWPLSLRKLWLGSVMDYWPSTGCVPALPPDLEECVILYGNVTCLPNKPLGVAASLASFSICSIWNSQCLGSNEIMGTVYNDLDSDGQQDVGENGLPNVNVLVQPGNVITSAANLGSYSAWVSAGDFTIEALPYLYQTPTGAAQTATFAAVGGQDAGNDLGLHLTPNIQDLRAYLSANPIRIGSDVHFWLTPWNVGSMDVNGTMRLTMDANQSFVSAVPPPTNIAGNVVEWSVASLMGQGGTPIDVVLHTSASAPLGTPVTVSLTFDPVVSDQTPQDNSSVVTSPVVGAFDPNDKRVVPTTATPAEVALGLKLDYTIRFQNTGTSYAEDVLITDQLTDLLDVTSFEFVVSSHPCQWNITNGQLQVFFDQIMLPDSGANQLASQGFVSFRMAPVPGLQNGQVVENSAGIVFDFNEPVITEPALFTVQEPVGIAALEQDGFSIAPNMVSHALWLNLAEPAAAMRAEVLDMSGRVVMDERISGTNIAMDVSALPSGCYRVRLSDQEHRWTAPFVKH